MSEKILKQNATHKAVQKGEKIEVYIKGFEFDGETFPDEFCYSIPVDSSDDLLDIFETIDENNRINAAEFADEMKGYLK